MAKGQIANRTTSIINVFRKILMFSCNLTQIESLERLHKLIRTFIVDLFL